MKLLQHQKEAVKGIKAALAIHNSTVAVLATGTGKTIIYLELANQWSMDGARVLILAHRRELIHQPIERAHDFYPILEKRMGVVMAGTDQPKSQVVVATVQTAARDKGRLESMGHFDYVILDECHHGTSSTYMKLVDHFAKSKWLGMTATPFRHDGDSLSRVFDSVAYRLPITVAIDKGILVPFDALGFVLPIKMDELEENEDGWNNEKLGSLLSAPNSLEIVYEKWKEHCSDRQTIIFTASVAQSAATSTYFRRQGIPAVAVSGMTPKHARDNILEWFHEGKIQVVANCQVWTEGVDVPNASAALMVCPTKSDLAYTQKLGRILRTAPGKKNALVLDFSPIEDRNIVMAGDILGVPQIVKRAETRARKAGLLVRASSVDEHGLVSSIDPADILVEALKYLRKGQLAWALQDYIAVASLGDNAMLAIEIPNVNRIAAAERMRSLPAGGWNTSSQRLYDSICKHRVWLCLKGDNWIANFIGEFLSMDEAITTSEKYMDTYFQPALAKKRRLWRNKPASDKQLKYLWYLGVSPPEGCTSGQAAQIISHRVATVTVDKARMDFEHKVMTGG